MNTPYRILLLIQFLCCMFFCAIPARSQVHQNYRFHNFNEKDGIEAQLYYSVVQDKQGFMWFGTNRGLYRYDGYRFTLIESPLDNASRGIGNMLLKLFVDKDNHLWCSSFGVLQILNLETMEFSYPEALKPYTESSIQQYIRDIQQYGDQIYISWASEEFTKYNVRTQEVISFKNKGVDSRHAGRLFTTFAYGFQDISVYSDKMVFYDANSNALKDSFLYPSTFTGRITQTFLQGDQLFIGTINAGVYVFHIPSKRFYRLSDRYQATPKKDIYGWGLAGSRLVYVGTDIEIVDTLRTTRNLIKPEYDHLYALNLKKLMNIFVDREQNVWFYGYDGLAMMPWQNQQIQEEYVSNSNRPDVDGLYVFLEPQSKKVNIPLSATNTLIRYSQDLTKKEEIKLPETVREIFELPDHQLWMNGERTIYRYDPMQKNFLPLNITNQFNEIIHLGSKIIPFDETHVLTNTYWNKGYHKIDLQTLKAYTFKGDIQVASQLKKDSFVHTFITPEIMDRDSNIWYKGQVGLFKWVRKTNQMLAIGYELNSKTPYLITPSSIAIDANNHLWITNGLTTLFEIIDHGNSFEKHIYNNLNGAFFTTGMIKSMQYCSIDSCLYFSTESGLTKFNVNSKKQIAIYTPEHGLPMNNEGYYFQIDKEHNLYEILHDRLIRLDFRNYKKNTFTPRPLFTKINVGNADFAMPWRKDPEKEWVLESTQNFVQFEFNAMVHNNSHQNRYSYQLVGYDTSWQSNQTNQTKSYTNLSPGHYEFKLVACNNDGLAAKPIYFKFYVKPPFYFTWWFITSCLVMLFTMIYIIYRFKVKQIKREEAMKTAFNKELANIEMKALRAQMNPHFIFNSLNSIQKFILSNQHFEASQYLTKFSRLIRLILDHAKEDMITLASEIETLSIYIGLEQMRFEDVFSYELRVHPLLNPETTLLPSMLIQPYIENAIRHGLLHRKLPGKLTVRFNFKTSHEMEVIILDDGIGRQQSAALKGKNEVKQKSYGMKITQDRLNNFNKIKNTQGSVQVLDVMNDQQVCIGTQVILVIPIQKLNQ